jgi:hypothetical protein
MSDVVPEAWDAGFAARRHDDPMSANPYPMLSEAWLEWGKGWLSLDQHYRNRDECFEW